MGNSNYIFCIDHYSFNMDGQNDPLTSFFADEPLFQQPYTIPQQPQSMAAAIQREISDLKAKVEKLSKLTAAQEERLSVQDSRLSAQEKSVTDRLVTQEQRLAAQEQRMANQERRAAEQEQRAANHAADHARSLQRAASYSESEYSQQTLADGESSTDDSEDEGLAKYFSSY